MGGGVSFPDSSMALVAVRCDASDPMKSISPWKRTLCSFEGTPRLPYGAWRQVAAGCLLACGSQDCRREISSAKPLCRSLVVTGALESLPDYTPYSAEEVCTGECSVG